MKHLSIILLILLMSMGAWAENKKDKHYMEVLSACSDSEVKEVVGLFVGTNLDLSCVKDSFDAFHASRELRFAEYKKPLTVFNNHAPKYIGNVSTYTEKVTEVTSLYAMKEVEASTAGVDFLYQVDDKFWYLFTNNGHSEMDILKVNDQEEPELILYTDPYGPGTNNHLLNLPMDKYLFLGNGYFNFTKVEVEQISYEQNGIKSYFLNSGGPFWFDTIETHSFVSDTETRQFINSGSTCMSKEDFLNASGWENVSFEGLEEVCVTQY